MSWVCSRRVTQEDYSKLNDRAEAFARRHDLDNIWCPVMTTKYAALEDYLDYMADGYNPDSDYYSYLRRLWRRIVRRAIGDDGIAYGYVGHSEGG